MEETTKRADRIANENTKLTSELDRLAKENDDLVQQIAKLQVEKEALENEVHELKKRVTVSDQAIIELSNQLETTQRIAQEAKEGFDRYKEENEKQKRKNFNVLLLGEIAFQFDRAVVRKILHGDMDKLSCDQQERWDSYERTLTVNQLFRKALRNDLSNEQMERWKDFENFCKDQHWYDIEHLISCMKDLKGPNRQESAHLPQSEKGEQTTDMLKIVAEESCRNNPGILKNYKRLIESLATYMNSDKPLAKMM